MIMLKAVGVDPLPNYTRDVKKGGPRWERLPRTPTGTCCFSGVLVHDGRTDA